MPSQPRILHKEGMRLFEPKPIEDAYVCIDPEFIAQMSMIDQKRKSCEQVEMVQDMGATVPYCNRDRMPCGGQCLYGYELPCLRNNKEAD